MAKALFSRSKKARFKQLMLLVLAMFVLAILLMLKKEPNHSLEWINAPKLQPFGFSSFESSSQEIPLCESMIVENWYSYHRAMVVEFDMYAKAKGHAGDQLQSRIKASHSQIKDMIRTTIGSVHPSEIRDPGLVAVKNRVSRSMEQIVGSEMVDQILIPTWNAYKVYQ